MKRKTSILAFLALGALALAGLAAGCGGDADADRAGNRADAAFIADMTTHHQGAIEMAKLARTRAEHPQVRRMAAAIVAAQEGEIADMGRIAGAMRAMGMHDAGGHMGMTAEQMGMDMDIPALERARPFDRAFLDAMIPHHRGAIAMAHKLLADGEQPALRRMAHDVVAAQSREIAQMRTWRARWYGSGRSGAAMHDAHR